MAEFERQPPRRSRGEDEETALRIPVRIQVQPDGTYVAACPDLPGCRVRARALDHVADRIEQKARGYLASLGRSLPEKPEPVTTAHEEIHAITGTDEGPSRRKA